MAHAPLHLLCVEPKFPGRLGAVADWLVRRRGYRCWFYCASHDPQPFWPAAVGRGLDIVPFQLGGVAKESAVAWSRHLERALCYTYGCWEVLNVRRHRPLDLVLGRSTSLGSSLFVPINYPGVPVVNFFDGYLAPRTGDIAAEIDPVAAGHYFLWRASSGAMDLLDLENGATPWTATNWQRNTYPEDYRDPFQVIFDGVDMRLFRARESRPRMIAGRMIPPETKVVSFVSRSLDRVRGFDRFLKLANRLSAEFPEAIFVVAGTTNVNRAVDIEFYGKNYLEHLLTQEPIPDPSRFWFMGVVPRTTIAELLAASDLHVCPGRVQPAARSMAEALASGCVVLAGDDLPVREFIENGVNGLLFPAADADALFERAREVLRDPAAHAPLARSGVEFARERLDQDVTMPRLVELFGKLIEEKC